tara:strand:+ start:1920 stop:2150 length:231 start_codon:yes stop_codon:yes gene_type:complete
MKAFLYIIITFMFIGTAYSQETVTTVSATTIINKGKIILQSDTTLSVLYKNEMYWCMIQSDEMFCTRPRDLGVVVD